MTITRVAMVHPDTKARINAPERAVKTYEASGWQVAPDDTAESSGSPAETGPAPAGKPRKADQAKEEGK